MQVFSKCNQLFKYPLNFELTVKQISRATQNEIKATLKGILLFFFYCIWVMILQS